MKIEADTVKGFRDYLPPESLQRAKIRSIVEKIYRLYGFQPVETPEVEYDELMRSDAVPGQEEDEAVSDRFRLQDRAGRNLGLRYEFTFQLSRIFKMNPTIKLPFKRYQIGNVFRDEPIRVGRTRQFTQCDIDIVGDHNISADAECLAVVGDILKELGIEAEIHINNRKLLDAIIESCELENKKQVLREIDKLDKIGEDMVKMNLKKYGDTNQVATIFKIMEKPLEFFQENKFEGSEDIAQLQKLSKQYGFVPVFRPNLVRGLSYYTGNIFEIVVKGTKTAIAGGGRYDKSVGKYVGREIPAVGVSFSLEALMGICSEQIDKIKIDPPSKAHIISIQQDNAAIKLSRTLRKSGISCSVSMDKIGKALEYANAYGIPYCIFVGKEEVSKKKFKVKDMLSGTEKELVEKSLIKLLSS